MDWYRWHNDTITDKKWRAIARRVECPVASVVAIWAALCENANQSPERGTLANWCAEDVAAALDLDPELVDGIVSAMEGKVIDAGRLTGWERRNPKREDPTANDRKRRQRERESRDVTQCHAPEREEEREGEGDTDITSVLKLHAGEAQDVEGQVNEVVCVANRGMMDNPAIGSLATPIPTSHGSREAVKEWLDLAPLDVVKRAVYGCAKSYKPDGRRRQIITMTYFTGAVQDAADRWKASQTRVSDGNRGTDNRGVAATGHGTPAPDRFAKLTIKHAG